MSQILLDLIPPPFPTVERLDHGVLCSGSCFLLWYIKLHSTVPCLSVFCYSRLLRTLGASCIFIPQMLFFNGQVKVLHLWSTCVHRGMVELVCTVINTNFCGNTICSYQFSSVWQSLQPFCRWLCCCFVSRGWCCKISRVRSWSI